MNKKALNITIVIVALIPLLYLYYIFNAQKKFHWIETYDIHKDHPYDLRVLRDLMKNYHHGKKFTIEEKKSVSDALFLKEDSSIYKNYFFIGSYSFANRSETDTLLYFVSGGNTAFFILNEIPYSLYNSLELATYETQEKYFSHLEKSRINLNLTNPKFQLKEDPEFIFTSFKKESPYRWNCFDGTLFDNYKYYYDILGMADKDYANFIHLKYGDGHIYIHLNPIAFTNYHLLSEDKLAYAERVLSYLPEGNTYMDVYNTKNHFKMENSSSRSSSPLTFILKNRSLRWGWYLLLFTLLLYLIVGGKRKQRVIPLMSEKKNSTLDFVKTLGQMYYSQDEHQKICVHMMKNMLHYIREKYYLPTSQLNDAFVKKLADKSGVDENFLKELITQYQSLNMYNVHVSKDEVIKFHEQINYFYNNCK